MFLARLTLLSILLSASTLFAAVGKVEVVDVPQVTLVYKSGTTPVSSIGTSIAKAFTQLQAELTKQKIEIKGPPFERPAGGDNANYTYEVGYPVATELKKVDPGSRLTLETRPASKAARVVVTGPYDQAVQGYKVVQDWMKSKRKERAGRPWVVYLDDPSKVSADQLRAEIYYPLK